MKTLLLSLSLCLMACGDNAPLADPCRIDAQWSPCALGSPVARCWVGGVCANGDESLCGDPAHPLTVDVVANCEVPSGLTCVTECEAP